MKKNVGSTDRVIRLLVAIVFGILVFNGVIAGTWGIITAIIAIMFLVSSVTGYCPVYVPFGISTRKGGSQRQQEDE